MNYKIFPTLKFDRELKRLSKKYPSLKGEYAELISILKNNPLEGTPIGHNCYKIRIAIASKGKGKSGGARIITYLHIVQTTVYLLAIYDKSEQTNITTQELKKLIRFIE